LPRFEGAAYDGETKRLFYCASAAGSLLLVSCGESSPPIERHLVAHAIAGCPINGTPTLRLTALGDFGSSRASATVRGASGSAVDLPTDLIGVQAELLPQGWWGIGYASPPGDVSFALWSSEQACDATDLRVAPSVGGQAMTIFDGGLFIAGLMPPPSGERTSAAFALALNLMTGEPSNALAMAGLPRPRAFASATAFGEGVLVAGGVDPNDPGDATDDVVVDTGFVYTADHFESAPIELGDARAHHGAVALVTGETLLVGGMQGDGSVLASLEAIDPVTRNSRFFQLGTLAQRRRDPVVLRLVDDGIVVAGGTDQNGAPVTSVEWFESDGSACLRQRCRLELPPAFDRAFVALASGAVLAAGGVDPNRGAPLAEVLWITPDGSLETLAPLSSEQRSTGRVRLVGAADGAVWLWNGRAWWTFDPWQGAFVVPDGSPDDGPDDDLPAPIEADAGLFLWLAREMPGDTSSLARVRGFRHGVRGPYTRDAEPMLLADPVHWVPDRPPGSTSGITFDREGLHLSMSGRAVLGDTIYADFALTVSAKAEFLPRFEIGDFVVGDATCAWPKANGAQIAITRQGASLALRVDDAERTCDGPLGRVRIGLRAPDGGSALVTNLTISRL
jgi:hypothetical protein